ncbi:MAG: NADH:ubiquinone reductase (Na(+)-transporting) subunit A, partial [Myxococcota bacterium]|nr:NADH:ubiquinone reductase (Na(+)-transporting) subunit A [Myxococcota bacterium]
QDVVAMGHLFSTGRLLVDRVVSLAGPVVAKPRLVQTRLGASTTELSAGETSGDAEFRIVAGSVIHGRRAQDEVLGYLGRYHQQLSCLAEDRERVFLGWLRPGMDKFSTIRAFASSLLGGRSYDFTTSNQGEHRAMVPIGMLERVMPLDIMPTFLLRALLVDDVENAEKLGCLELDEEDLALCSFVSPGKEDYGVALRRVLDDIWREG